MSSFKLLEKKCFKCKGLNKARLVNTSGKGTGTLTLTYECKNKHKWQDKLPEQNAPDFLKR